RASGLAPGPVRKRASAARRQALVVLGSALLLSSVALAQETAPLPAPEPAPAQSATPDAPAPVAAPTDAAPTDAASSEPAWHHGTSLMGEPRYAPGFPHFDYVNADAPKGG